MIQGDDPNEWLTALPDQRAALETYKRDHEWKYQGQGNSSLMGTREVFNDIIINRTTYRIYLNSNPKPYLYIGQPFGKKRRVIELPSHPGSQKCNQATTAGHQGKDACVNLGSFKLHT